MSPAGGLGQHFAFGTSSHLSRSRLPSPALAATQAHQGAQEAHRQARESLGRVQAGAATVRDVTRQQGSQSVLNAHHAAFGDPGYVQAHAARQAAEQAHEQATQSHAANLYAAQQASASHRAAQEKARSLTEQLQAFTASPPAGMSDTSRRAQQRGLLQQVQQAHQEVGPAKRQAEATRVAAAVTQAEKTRTGEARRVAVNEHQVLHSAAQDQVSAARGASGNRNERAREAGRQATAAARSRVGQASQVRSQAAANLRDARAQRKVDVQNETALRTGLSAAGMGVVKNVIADVTTSGKPVTMSFDLTRNAGLMR
ncbi:hypothetical protein [Streptomyces sp. gCLA4]|uniref:hypothetical protein n=1 Tax=Streptomyces sp. gCLA4 TaxID=1873416 RepID=UPI001601B9C9|nr:hypothetical protein [Streptomyces sp. gCLA4]